MSKKDNAGIPNIFGKGKGSGVGSSGSGSGSGFSDKFFYVLGSVLGILLVLFILMGGVNQRKFIEAVQRVSWNVSKTVGEWMQGPNIEVNDDGVYLKP